MFRKYLSNIFRNGLNIGNISGGGSSGTSEKTPPALNNDQSIMFLVSQLDKVRVALLDKISKCECKYQIIKKLNETIKKEGLGIGNRWVIKE